MPTYVCSVPQGLLDEEQKSQIAQAIGRRHSEATGAQPYFVQVQIDEPPSSNRYLGGTETSKHIWVRGDIRAGRAEEVRTKLMLNIMEDLSRIAGIPRSAIWVYLCNLAPTDMLEHGHILPLPGKEKEWFDALPYSLQQYLKGLGEPAVEMAH